MIKIRKEIVGLRNMQEKLENINASLVKISTHCAKLETSLARSVIISLDENARNQNGTGALKV